MDLADAKSTVQVERPVPHLSAPSVEFIADKLRREGFDFVVEFGSGASTRFFLAELLAQPSRCTFISVETIHEWFLQVVEMMRQDLRGRSLSAEELAVQPWDTDKLTRFLRGANQTVLDVPPELRQLATVQAKARDRLLSRLKLRLLPSRRPHDGKFSVIIDSKVTLCYMLRGEMFKDQYGESPNKPEYIDAGLGPIRRALAGGTRPVKAAFLIDGGPRADIVNAALDLEEQHQHFRPSVFLFEAQRRFYHAAMDRRKTGQMLKGSNRTLTGQVVYEVKRPVNGVKFRYWFGKEDATAEEMAEREMWYYAR